MQAHSADIVRCKGTVAVHGHLRLFSFQGVHETLQLKRLDEKVPEDSTAAFSEVTFIGRALDEDAIRSSFRTCAWQPLPPGWREDVDTATKRTYYTNSKTGVKTWQKPVEAVEAPPVFQEDSVVPVSEATVACTATAATAAAADAAS